MASIAVVPRYPAEGIGAQFLRLEGAVSLSNLGRGTQLFSPGDTCDRVFALLDGRVKLSVQGQGGKNCLMHIVEPGEIIGESALLGDTVYRATAEVIEAAAVAMVPTNSVLSYAENHPEWWQLVTPILRTRIRHLEEQLQWVSFLEVEQRLARLLLRWAESQASVSGAPIELRLSQKELSDMVGATRETASTALNRLQRAGCIELRRRCVEVLSLDGLRPFADGVASDKKVHPMPPTILPSESSPMAFA